MKLSSLSIVLPAYNESENIIETIKESISAAQVCSLEHEIIIVDDGSKDETVSIVRSLVATNNRIRLIENEVNRGYGTTVWRGITEAKHEYVFFTDADGQFNLKELTDFTPFSKEYDAIIGYRKVRSDPFHRKLNAFGWNSLIRLLFGLKVKDIDCAFKLIKREALIDLPIMTGSAMTVAEILIRLHHRGVVFKELPVTHLPRINGTATGANPLVIFATFGNLFNFFRKYDGPLTSKEAIKFALVGAMNTFLDIGVYTFVTRTISFFAESFLSAKIFSFFIGTISSFFLQTNFGHLKINRKLLFLWLGNFMLPQ